MCKHYLELKCFLEELEAYPEIATDPDLQIFASEERLYGPRNKPSKPPDVQNIKRMVV